MPARTSKTYTEGKQKKTSKDDIRVIKNPFFLFFQSIALVEQKKRVLYHTNIIFRTTTSEYQ